VSALNNEFWDGFMDSSPLTILAILRTIMRDAMVSYNGILFEKSYLEQAQLASSVSKLDSQNWEVCCPISNPTIIFNLLRRRSA
jgi:hypothetical protein